MASNKADSENSGSGSTPFPTSSSERAATPATAESPASGSTQPSELLNRLVAGAHQAIDRFAGQAAPRLDRWNEGVHTAGTRLRERAGQAGAMGEDLGETMRSTVRERPLAAIGTAFAIGFLIARLTR